MRLTCAPAVPATQRRQVPAWGKDWSKMKSVMRRLNPHGMSAEASEQTK